MQGCDDAFETLRNGGECLAPSGFGDGAPAYLDPQETSEDSHATEDPQESPPLAVQSRSQNRLHSPHRLPRAIIVSALWAGRGADADAIARHDARRAEHLAGSGPAAGARPMLFGRRAQRLGHCGCLPSLRRGAGGSVGVDLARCRDRLCPLCSLVRGREVRARVVAAVKGWNALRFVTLTLKADASSLADRFRRLFDCFAKLRRDEVWSKNVTACIAVPEVTIGRGGQWHTHLHCLVDGAFIPQPQLKKAWHRITGDSFVVGVEAVHEREKAATYVAQYIAAGNEVHRWAPDRIREYALATHGMRMVRTYGNASMTDADDDNEPDVIGESSHLVEVAPLLRAEEQGIEQVRHAIDILASLGKAHAMALDREPPPRRDAHSPKLATLPSAHDLAFAVAICELVNSKPWTVPSPEECERCRVSSYSLPAPPPVREYSQMVMDVMFDRIHR